MWLFFNIFMLFSVPTDPLGEMVGRNFLDLISSGNWQKAAVLMADTVNFDGETVKTHKKVVEKLKFLMSRHQSGIKFRKYYFLSGEDALIKFGKLPERFQNTDLKNTVVVLGRRLKGGLAVILKERDGIKGRWRVVALTD